MTKRRTRPVLATPLALVLAVASPGGLAAQEPADTAAGEPAEPAVTEGDTPPIGMVEFFGLEAVEEDSLRAVIGLGPEGEEIAEGDAPPLVEWGALPRLAARLAGVPQVAEARLETVCCHGGRTVLFVGVREQGAEDRGGYWPDPEGPSRLAPEILEAYQAFIEALAEAVRAGRTEDDLSRGHSLVADSAARSHQLRFPALAEAHLPALRAVLRSAGDAGQRAVAAAVIGYHPDKEAVAADLVRALRDPDPAVRNNAARSLAAIAVYAKQNSEAGVEIPIEPLVEMLRSLIWTDRNKALSLLLYLTPRPGGEMPPSLREAVPDLAEMARWRSPGHALPAFVLLGRMAGLSDQETMEAWREGRRDEVIERARAEPRD